MKRQTGQAMVLSLVFMVLVAMAALFAFNAAQLSNNSTRLQNTADNTAFSVAAIAARDLNFKAYTNRAMVANQVAVAQMVGLSSWFRMIKEYAETVDTLTRWIPYVGPVISAIANVIDGINTVAQRVLPVLVGFESVVLKALSGAQSVMHYAGFGAALTTAGKIVKQNDPNAQLDLMQNPMLGMAAKELWLDFQGSYDRYNAKAPYHDKLDVIADSRDPFTSKRSYRVGFMELNLGLFKFKTYKAGGSNLRTNGDDMETWTAMDTISTHFAKWRCKWSGCGWKRWEVPWGYASTKGNDEVDIRRLRDRQWWGRSRGTNPKASNWADSSPYEIDMRAYTGVESSYLRSGRQGLSAIDTFKVVVSKPQANVRTSKQVQLGRGRLDIAEGENMLASRMSALAAAEAYYSRPSDLSAWVRRDGKGEYGNLYNPFWQPRLADTTSRERAIAYANTRALRRGS
ncbi:Tad domain-containing protein [Gallaecimonas sp. GXIMD4217]|uniref:Tad domain-containing protein n=1 Tax=Gallaecimonas sp. GXIMD4217 TaxID=3131927 RepID=UPI00311ACC98